MLQLTGVSRSFGPLKAVGPIDLDVPSGETTVLIGPSGCGKSTLLRLMIGLIEPDAGLVEFEGDPVTRETATELRRRMGYVIQDGGLFPHLTARGNLTLMTRYLGWDRSESDERIENLTELTQFPRDGLQRYPAQLSGGQRQRVSLMRALMLDPHVLLLDEPLGALDPMIRADLQTDLKRIFQTLKKTVVLVTHDMGEAAYFGHTIVLLRDGEIVQKGRIGDLLHAPVDDYVTRFIRAQRSPLEGGEDAG